MPTRADYAKINIACKDLGLDKYDLLTDRYSLASSKELTAAQVIDLFQHFRAKGWRPKKATTVKSGRSGSTKKDDNFVSVKPGPAARRQKYILAMWNSLGYDVAKLHKRCKKQFNIDRFEWVVEDHDLFILITDLRERCCAAGLDPEAS
jgi:hypothetical protein